MQRHRHPAAFAVTAFALLVAALASCTPEVILPGTRYPVRAPLADSLPTDTNPDPLPPALPANKAVAISLPRPVPNADYPQHGGNAAHSGVSAALSAQPVLVWAVPVGTGNTRQNRVSATPVVAPQLIVKLNVPPVCWPLKSASTVRRAATTGTVRRFTAQSFCGASASRPPLAPPRLSLLRCVTAAEKAVNTRSETEISDARIDFFSAAISAASTKA